MIEYCIIALVGQESAPAGGKRGADMQHSHISML